MANGKQKLIISIVLFVFFLILLVTFIATGFGSNPSIWILYSIVILISTMFLGWALYMNKRINTRVKDLSEPYREVYFNAQDLITLHVTSLQKRREISESILEIFEHANLDKRDVNQVIGNDIEGYVKQFLSNEKTSFSLPYIFLYSTTLFLFFLLFMKTYLVIRADSISITNFENKPLDVGITLTYFLISYLFYPLLMYTIHYTAKNQLNHGKKWIIAIPLLIPMLLMSALIFIDNEGLREFLDAPIPVFGNVILFIVGWVLLVVFGLLTRYLKE